jgi:hypothetical protein
MKTDLETTWNHENSEMESLQQELDNLKEEIKQNNESNELKDSVWIDKNKEKPEKTEKSFTFKPIAISVLWSKIKIWKDWENNITTNLEFAWWRKNLSLYGYTKKIGTNMQNDLMNELSFLLQKILNSEKILI